jgi:nucleolysin TIA-1/TIAR
VNSKGFNYGFVEYDDPGAAERGMATLNGRRIHNNVSANTPMVV